VLDHGRGGPASTSWVAGPAIVEEYDATCVIPPGAAGRLHAYGNIVIDLRARVR